MIRFGSLRPRRSLDTSARRYRADSGFTLMELLIVIVIVGLLNGLTVAFQGNEWQQERVRDLALGLAGWLEEVRSNALRETSDTATAGGCVVTVQSLTNAGRGTALASVQPTSCAASATYQISSESGDAARYDIATSNAATITFTPRGSVTTSSDAVVKILLVGSQQMRCVRVSAILGLIRVGNNAAATSTSASCSDYVNS